MMHAIMGTSKQKDKKNEGFGWASLSCETTKNPPWCGFQGSSHSRLATKCSPDGPPSSADCRGPSV